MLAGAARAVDKHDVCHAVGCELHEQALLDAREAGHLREPRRVGDALRRDARARHDGRFAIVGERFDSGDHPIGQLDVGRLERHERLGRAYRRARPAADARARIDLHLVVADAHRARDARLDAAAARRFAMPHSGAALRHHEHVLAAHGFGDFDDVGDLGHSCGLPSLRKADPQTRRLRKRAPAEPPYSCVFYQRLLNRAAIPQSRAAPRACWRL